MTKVEQYQEVIRNYTSLLDVDLPTHVHLNNLCALLKKEFNFFWVGFYERVSEDQLRLSSYQGEVPCFNIKIGKGVCGTAAAEGKTQLVDDVYAFPGYIACHPEPNSEIVVPGMMNGRCLFVLDIDHVDKAWFSETDTNHLEQLVDLTVQKLYAS